MSYYGERLGFLVWFAYYYSVKPDIQNLVSELNWNKTKHLYAWNNIYTLTLIVLHSDVLIWEMVSFGTALNRIVWENNKPQKQWTLVLKHQSFMLARTNEIRGFKFRRVSWQQKCLNSAFFQHYIYLGWRLSMRVEFLWRNKAAPRRSLKWRVTYRIGVHTIPDRFTCRHEKLSGILWTYSPRCPLG